MKPIFILIASIGFSTAGWTQTHSISLEQSKKAALLYSNDIKNGRLKIQSSEADIAAAKSDYLPNVSGVGVGVYGFKNFVNAIPPTLEKGIDNFYLLSVTGTEAIYAGGKIRTGNMLAALQLETSRIVARQSEDSVLLTTGQKYWNIVDLQQQAKTLAANETYLDSLLAQQANLLKAGLIARNDLLKIKVQLSHLHLNERKLNNGRQLAILDFCLYTGIPYDSLLVMEDTLDLQKRPVIPAINPDTSLASNNNYQLLTKNVEGEKLQTRLTRADYLPSLSAGVGVSEAGVINAGLGSKFMPVALATLKVPISDAWWGRGKQKMKQRSISETIAANNLRDGQNQLKVGIMKSWYDLRDGLSEIDYARDNLDMSRENLKVNDDNYKAGLASISDLLDAQAAYQQAASDLVTAYARFETRKAAYYYSIGKIGENGSGTK